jgi:hypothetical protein
LYLHQIWGILGHFSLNIFWYLSLFSYRTPILRMVHLTMTCTGLLGCCHLPSFFSSPQAGLILIVLTLSLLILFSCLPKPAVEHLYWIFHFSYYAFRKFVWLPYIISISWLMFPLCAYILVLISLVLCLQFLQLFEHM